MRLIDADALIEKYGDWYTEEGTEVGYIGAMKGIINSAPTIEPKQADDLISRADAMAYPISWENYDKRHGDTKFVCGVESYREYIEYLPSAQERKTGRWIDAVLPNDNGGLPVQVCDQCNTFFPLAYTGGGHHFCPNCGAKMEVEHDEKGR